MTEYGSPPPGGWPAGQAPHESHDYTAPPGYRPTTAFDPKTVNPLDWAIMVGAVVALILSFFSFYVYKPKGAEAEQVCKSVTNVPSIHEICNGIDNSAWHGFFGWFGVLLLLIAAAVVAVALFIPQVNFPASARMIALVLAALGFVFVLIALFVVPDGDYEGRTIPAGSSDVDAGHGFAYWVVLILAAIVTALCALRLVQMGSQPGADAGAGSAGAAGAAGMTHPGGTPGYPPPTQQQAYGQQPVDPAQQPGYPAQPPPSAAQPGGYAQQPPPAPPQPGGYQPPPPAPQPGGQQPGYQPQSPPQQPSGYQQPQPGAPQPGYQPGSQPQQPPIPQQPGSAPESAAPQQPGYAPPPPPPPPPAQAAPPAPPQAQPAPPAEAAQEPSTDSAPDQPPPGYIPPPQQEPPQQ